MQGTLGAFQEGTMLSLMRLGFRAAVRWGRVLTLAVIRCQDVSVEQESRLILSLGLFHIDFSFYLFVF